MELLKVRLIERIKRTPSTESFRFTPEKKIEFIPGQFLQIIFDEASPNNRELNKYLSFSSSPRKEYIEVTKRLSVSQFSQRLNNLEIGKEILLKAPFGNCVFKDEYERIAFLIGGIGITPVISIMEYVAEKKLNTDIVLAYSNKTEEDIAFKNELDNWQIGNNNIKIFYTLTDCEPKQEGCIFGRIDKNLLQKKVKDLNQRIIFIFGPPKMVEAMKGLCTEVNCNKENIKSESFIGY